MNRPNDNQQTGSFPDDPIIDRLVDGELPEAERRELLLKFEEEPAGWRRCAVAFLEAQVWRQALASVAAPNWVAHPEFSTGVSSGFANRRRFWRPLAKLSGLAAGLAAAFALGWIYQSGRQFRTPGFGVKQPVESVAALRPPVADAPGSPRQSASLEVVGNSKSEILNPKTEATEALASLNSIIKRWEQQGYSVQTQPRVLSLEANDGRKLKIPVQDVRIRFKGDHVY